MAFFTGQQAHAGVTGRGSTPSTRAVPRRQGDGVFHRSAGARGADRARFHAVYPRCPTSAGRMALFTGQQAHAGVTERGSTPSTRAVPRRQGDGAFHRSAGARGCNRARFHAVYPRCPTSAGRMAFFTGQQAHAGVTGRGSTPSICAVSRQQGGQRGCTGQQEYKGRTERGSTPSTRAVPRRQGDGAFHRSAGARGCDGARFHAVYPRGPTSAGRMALFTGQQAHAGVTERGSTPSICAIPRQRGG